MDAVSRRVSVGDLLDLRVNVRFADVAHYQTNLGFWPACLTAFALRAYGFFHFPFLDEEGYLIRDAVNSLFGFGPQSGQAPFWENLLFRTPFWNSQAITPLWWWTQFLARLGLGHETLSTRLPEFVFGMIGLALFYRLARRLFRPPVPALLAWLLAVHDVYLWVGTKAQYVESIIFCCAVLIALGLLAPPRNIRPGALAAGGTLLASAYFLLKGLTLALAAAAFAAAQTALAWAEGRRPDVRRIARGGLVAAAAALPLLAWLAAGQAYLTAHYQVRFGNNYVQTIGQMLYWLTLGYGTGKGEGLVGPPYFALVIYSHGDAWPVSTFLAPLVFAGMCISAGLVVRRALGRRTGRASGSRADAVALYVTTSIGLTLTPLVLKGSFGERYHVLYLAAALLAAGMVLQRWWDGRDGRWGALIAATGVYVGVMLSWTDWTAGAWRPGWPFVAATAAGLACGGVYALAQSTAARRVVVVAVVGLAVALAFVRGPLHWGRFAPFAPEPRSPVLDQVEAIYHGLAGP